MKGIRLKPRDDSDRDSDEIAEEALNSGKEKMTTLGTENLFTKNKLRRKGLITLRK